MASDWRSADDDLGERAARDEPPCRAVSLSAASLGQSEPDTHSYRTDLFFITIYLHFPLLHRSRYLYSLHHPASILSAPSLALVFAVLAIAAPYHDNPNVRERGEWWYTAARDKIEVSIAASVSANGERATLSVEMVQVRSSLHMGRVG